MKTTKVVQYICICFTGAIKLLLDNKIRICRYRFGVQHISMFRRIASKSWNHMAPILRNCTIFCIFLVVRTSSNNNNNSNNNSNKEQRTTERTCAPGWLGGHNDHGATTSSRPFLEQLNLCHSEEVASSFVETLGCEDIGWLAPWTLILGGVEGEECHDFLGGCCWFEEGPTYRCVVCLVCRDSCS